MIIIKNNTYIKSDKCNQGLVFKAVTFFEAPSMTNETVLTTSTLQFSNFTWSFIHDGTFWRSIISMEHCQITLKV